eukprot:scaffold4.g4766.t1
MGLWGRKSSTNDENGAEHADEQQAFPAVKRRWWDRFSQQFCVLVWKNCLVNWRNFTASLLRFLAPLFFMFLLWLVNIAYRADSIVAPYVVENTDPAITQVAPIPSCADDMYVRFPCYDFYWTPNTSTEVVALMRAANPGRPIPADEALGFASIADVNAWMLAHPEQSPGVPIQVAAQKAIATWLWKQAGREGAPEWAVSTSMYAHPSTSSINIVGQAIGPFVFAANMFTFVLLLSAVVAERERGRRQALRTAGMLDSAFWLSWLAFELMAALFFSLLLIAFGAAFQARCGGGWGRGGGFGFFLKNSFVLVFLLFFLFQVSMISVAFLLSTFVSKTSSAINLGFVVFICGWVMQLVVAFGYPYDPDLIGKVPVLTVIFTLCPWVLLAKGSADLGLASADETSLGISWTNRAAYCQDVPDPAEQARLYDATRYQARGARPAASAIYFDTVLADENGVRKGKPWYFLTSSYWIGAAAGRGRGAARTVRGLRALRPPLPEPAGADAGASNGSGSTSNGGTVDPDVAAEEERMRELMGHRAGSGGVLAAEADATNAAEVYGLQKVFGRRGACCGLCGRSACCGAGGSSKCCGGGRRRGRRKGSALGEFWAVHGSWFAIERGRVFCLLGPNGAGKSTTINCLTGVLPPSGGDALVYGESFDVLWSELTGAEHLWLFGRVKGLPAGALRAEAARLLESVKLSGAAGVRTVAYSGGMRRRLSVALALLGDPLIVYLDEPTTGMDPISRRHVWDVIEASKRGRAIVLTTHSMEEADVLGDTIAIMCRGRLRCFGSSLRLKQRFGSGYQVHVSVSTHGPSLPNLTAASQQPAAPAGGGDGDDDGASAARGLGADPSRAALAQRAQRVKAYFLEHLGVTPVEETKASGAGPDLAFGTWRAQAGLGGRRQRRRRKRARSSGDRRRPRTAAPPARPPTSFAHVHTCSQAYMLFLLPKDAEAALPGFLRALEARRYALGITDLQISLTSLEEVFLSIARVAELEAAAAEGQAEVEVELEEGGTLEVPLGEQFVTDPATGRHYEIKWAQDDHGNLQARCSCLTWTRDWSERGARSIAAAR